MQRKDNILTGIEDEERISIQKKRIMERLGATDEQWNDYKWQLANRFICIDDFADLIGLSPEQAAYINEVGKTYRYAHLRITFHLFRLMILNAQYADKQCRRRRNSIPSEI